MIIDKLNDRRYLRAQTIIIALVLPFGFAQLINAVLPVIKYFYS